VGSPLYFAPTKKDMRNIHAQDEDIDGPDIMEVSILFIPFLLNKIRTYSYIVNYAYV
jgi:hypothetical protein